MKYELKDQTLKIYLEGELNSFSSESVEKEIDNLTENNEFKSLVLDMNDLIYLSSAGIRIMMRIKQRYDDLLLDNMPSDVYDVFSMVGLASFFKINKK